MKKVLLLFDSTNFSRAAFDFMSQLNEKEPLLATGAFVPQAEFSNLWSYASAAAASQGAALAIPLVEEEDAEAIVANIRQFEDLCKRHQIAYHVHKDYTDFVVQELRRESRFSDLIILSSDLFYKGIPENPMEMMKYALHDTECPVIVVPEKECFPESIILAYDGSKESVFAIKQFAYLFPELRHLPALMVYADKKPGVEFPNETEIVELVTQHFPDLTLFRLEINPKKYFSTWINEKKHAILVSGSFGRSIFSQAFKKSFVMDVIREHEVPVFIAHQ